MSWGKRTLVALAGAAITVGTWPAPSAQAVGTTVSGTVSTVAAPCSSGYVEVWGWQPDASLDNGGAWSYLSYGLVTNGAYAFDPVAATGATVTVRAFCYDGSSAPVWFGGALAKPSSPTATSSKVLVDGQNSFGSLTTPPRVTLSGWITAPDGSMLPYYDRNGVPVGPSVVTRSRTLPAFGISGSLAVYAPGATPDRDYPVTTCTSDQVGQLFRCSVPSGVFDLYVQATGFDTRPRATFSYPRTDAKVANFVVPATNLADLRFATAQGPAAVLKSAPGIGGVAVVGNSVSASPGIWSDAGYPFPELEFSYHWLVNGSVVSSGPEYTPAPSDKDKSLVLRVTVSRPLFATATAESAAQLVQAPADTRLASAMTAKFAAVKRNRKGSVKVVVTAGGMGAVGRVVVAEGARILGSRTLGASNNGKTRITFAKLRTKGLHTLTVTYFGTPSVKGCAITRIVKAK